MTKYREILRLCSLGLSQQSIADSCGVSKKTVNRVLKRAKELNIHWPLDENDTDAALAAKFFPSSRQEASTRAMPNFEHIRKELLHNGVIKKLLWMEYMEKRINQSYQELAEHYCIAIIPARVRTPKDKPNAEGIVGNISTWIIASLRNEHFFSLYELNKAIHKKLILLLFNQRPFQKRKAAGKVFFLGKKSHIWPPCLLPVLNYANGKPQQFNSIITYRLQECYTLFLINQ